MNYLLGVDVGTTSLKAVLFDENGTAVKSVTKDYTLLVSGDHVEYPADQYWALLIEALEEIEKEYSIYAMSIDTQCETMILADASGKPLANAIVWLDNRAEPQAAKIRKQFDARQLYEITGQPEVTATWPACKLLWFRENCPEIWKKTDKIFLLEDYLLYRLTGEFVTEPTLQSSSLYYNIKDNCWWDDMLDYLCISPSKLPRLCKCGEVIGKYHGIFIATGAMDQVAGAIGSGIVKKDRISEMTGTTMVIFAPTDSIPSYDPQNKIPCHINYDGSYCLLPWSPTAGMALKWFRNNFCEAQEFEDLSKLAETIPPGSEGLTFLPYLCGSTMPRYNPEVKGCFYGLTLAHTRGHAVRSIMEAVSCMLKNNLEHLGITCTEIRSSGGGAKSSLWCQIKADLCNIKVSTLTQDETACLGSAILAGTATGLFSNVACASDRFVALNHSYLPGKMDYSDCYRKFRNLEDKFL